MGSDFISHGVNCCYSFLCSNDVKRHLGTSAQQECALAVVKHDLGP
jgi:hypothetical protein